MKLRNKHDHMKGKSVLCNGTHYEVGPDGIVEVTDANDAKRLRASKDWLPVKNKADDAENSGKTPEAKKPQPKKPAPPTAPPAEPEAAEEAAEAEPEPVEEEPGEKAVDEEPAGEAEGEANEWPDPTMDMSKAELQEIADAYEVEYDNKTNKQGLVDAIMHKMYG
jgi:hypothetical protein